MYVLLTGAISNAGDYLIKDRAIKLLKEFRTKRKIITFDRWKRLTEEQLEIINSSRALILCGGPAYQHDLYPGIYPLSKDLSEVRVPIIAFGLGWKKIPGKWEDTFRFNFTPKSFELLHRIENSGFKSSCRDYLTLNMLLHKGCKNHIMTGCPTWYSLSHIGKTFKSSTQVKKVAFSIGRSFVGNKKLLLCLVDILSKLKEIFADKLICTFHHPLEYKFYKEANNSQVLFYKEHRKLLSILKEKGIKWVDISRSANNLISFYDAVDLHIGFRVHAHIYLLSIRKPSILLVEDGRGYGVCNSLGGLCFEAVEEKSGVSAKIMHKLGIKNRHSAARGLPEDLVKNLLYEIENNFPRSEYIPHIIDRHFEIMKNFICQLP